MRLMVVLLAVSGIGISRGEEGRVSEAKWAALPAHPRLFADAARFEELKKEVVVDAEAGRYYGVLRRRADELLAQEPVTYTLKGKRLLDMSRQAEECILVSAMVYRISGEAKYGERALQEMRTLAAFPNWNPSHFLDVAEATFAMAVGYDWLYDTMPAAERQSFASMILKKGLRESFPAEGKKEMGWIHGTNNWNQVCHGGLVIGALAIAERDPEMAKQVVERALANLHYAAECYAPDGIYPEGPGYWGYGTSYQVAMIAGLRSAFGGSFGMDQFPGFLKSADFMTQVVAPAGRYFSYADSVPQRGCEPAMFWFARETKRPDLLRWDLAEIARLEKAGGKLERLMPLGLVWREGGAVGDLPLPPKSWFGNGKVPLGIHRSAWGDPMATFLATKGGVPKVSHGHMDVGEFLLEAEGIAWAVDLGMQNYYTLESQGVDLWDGAQKGQRWKVFRLGSESHNILRFNDAPQSVDGRAEVVKSDVEKQLTVFDLSNVYEAEVASVRRGVRLLVDGNVMIQDEWKCGAKPAAVAFQWLTRAEVKIAGNELTLKDTGRTLKLRVISESAVKIEVEDFSKPVQPYDAPNPKLKRIRILTETAAGQSGGWAVIASPGGRDSGSVPVPVPPLGEW